jgi:hypothetical protein
MLLESYIAQGPTRFARSGVNLCELLEHPESHERHNAVCKDNREGVKSSWIGQSAAKPTTRPEGSTIRAATRSAQASAKCKVTGDASKRYDLGRRESAGGMVEAIMPQHDRQPARAVASVTNYSALSIAE